MGFALKMVSDVRDGFTDPNKSRTSRLYCGVHRPFYTHPRNYTHSLVTAVNGTYIQIQSRSSVLIYLWQRRYCSLPLSDFRFLWRWGTLSSIILTPWSLAEIKRCSEQPTAFRRADKTITVPHCVVPSYSVPISAPCLLRQLVLQFRRQTLRFNRNVGQYLPGYTSLHARRRCCSLASFVSVGPTNKRDRKGMWQKIRNETKTGGDFALDLLL